MAIVRKLSIGVMPFAKMFRIAGLGGAAADAVLTLRSKHLPDDYYTEVGVNTERTAFRLNDQDQSNVLQLTPENIVFTKDYYESDKQFDFSKILDEFRAVWGALNGILGIQDIRRIGIVAEYRLSCGTQHPSAWLREKLTTLKSPLFTDKFRLRYEERELASDGKVPDPKRGDFINYIYDYYDSSIDGQHPEEGYVNASLDVQRYYAPLLTGNVGDEVLKLHKRFDAAERRFDEHLKVLGATHAKK